MAVLKAEIEEKQPELTNRQGVVFQHEKTQTYIVMNVRQSIVEPVIPLPCHVSLMLGKRVLQRFVVDAKPMTTDLVDKMKILENARITAISLLGNGI
ncbi:hypothetical protein AVEN_119710-1 [Araneus ventricosus]|uniref:Uncharacterized protein n=1 Tax=Araneus ventricosus TaxID=182803 RepID=A0A4Y2PIP9_ARAVE|nr:hypothetical protein AVEN_119710-1 [Araneus ventricosus]